MTIEASRLPALSRIGRLLDEAVDMADAGGETLLSAQIAQVIHTLDAQVARIGASRRDPRPVDPSGTVG